MFSVSWYFFSPIFSMFSSMHSYFCSMDCRIVMGIPCNWVNATLVSQNLSNCLIIFSFSATGVFFTHYFGSKRFKMRPPHAKQQLHLKTCCRVRTPFPSQSKKMSKSLIGYRSVFSPAHLIPTQIKCIFLYFALPSVAYVCDRKCSTKEGENQTMMCPQRMIRNKFPKTGVFGIHFCFHRLTFNKMD